LRDGAVTQVFLHCLSGEENAMNDVDKASNNMQLIECEVCLTEIPKSGALSEETSDYVMYFCGLECYDKWREQDDDKEA